MEYIAIFGLAMIFMLVFMVSTIDKSLIVKENRGTLRVGLFFIPAVFTFIVWAVRQLWGG